MFLSNIKKNPLIYNTNQFLILDKISKVLKFPKKKTLSKKTLFSQIKLNQPNFKYKKEKTQQNLISYVIKINLTKTNTLVTITDVLGAKVSSFSAGLVGLTKRQKRQQPDALIKVFKFLLLKSKILKNKVISLQLTYIKARKEFSFLKRLKSVLFISSIKSYALHPHNGCRPKKLKRFKRRTKRMVLN